MGRKAILAGASGLIGSNLLQQLLNSGHYAEVLVLVRKHLPIKHPKLKQLVVDFEQLSHYAADIKGDVVFCCLGTTKKQTPDQAAYRKIDYQYPLDIAWIAQTNGAESYHLVSSIGAHKNSSVFYTRTKGEVESDLKAVPFKSIFIYRPSFLIGDRKNNPFFLTLLGKILTLINPLFIGSLRKWRTIRAKTVASAMLVSSLNHQREVFIYESDEIQRIGGEVMSRDNAD